MATEKQPESLVDIETIAQIVCLSVKNIRKRVHEGTIPYRRMGNTQRPRLRFYPSEVRLWVDGAELKSVPNGISILREQAI